MLVLLVAYRLMLVATLQMRGGADNRRQEAALALFVLSFLMYLHCG